MNRLQGKRCVVTGGGSGIGRASAQRLAGEGASVLVVGRSVDNTNETVSLITAAGGRAAALVADATSESDVQAMVRRCLGKFGGLDVFFANAGTPGTNAGIFDQTVEEWNEVWRINVISCMLAIKHAGLHMAEQGAGSIILTSSAGSLRANAGAISYSASKAAVNNLTQTAANAFTGKGVRVNAVLPGLVETQMTRKVFEYARERGKADRIGHMTPLQRAGQPHEIAAMVAFLASDDSSFVTGQLYAVDGGISSTHPHGRIPV
ncbi:SDR family oxidoreductase [Variovorax paradoxus]|nr:SDR family oxidoreductase [Variovorax paradoxus]MBT2301963.1 SDR family oxidoreductase [Variovorax paradoxus]